MLLLMALLTIVTMCEIGGSHGNYYEDYYRLLACDAV
jgi:hypothetical protein